MAFDNINREKLWRKIKNIGVSENMVELLKEIYKNVNCCVKMKNGRMTEEFYSKKEVRQGCQLSSLLFALFIDDIAEDIAKGDTHEPFIGNLGVPLFLYADDIVLISQSKTGLRRQLKNLEKYCKKWDQGVSVKKTKVMIFDRSKKRTADKWLYSGKELETVNQYMYLGITMNRNRSWNKHLEEVIDIAEKKLGIIRKIY